MQAVASTTAAAAIIAIPLDDTIRSSGSVEERKNTYQLYEAAVVHTSQRPAKTTVLLLSCT
jgi:hypothetical protein